MTTTGEYATAVVLPSAWKLIISREMAYTIARQSFTDAVHAPIQFTDGSYEMASLRDSRFYARLATLARDPGHPAVLSHIS